MKDSSTRQRLLDSAKSLFAREGYQATSMRAITGSAGVNLASANYYFGSKEALLKVVLDQHLRLVNEARLNGLKKIKHEARREHQRPAVLDVLRAFIEPVLHLKGKGRGDSDFGILIGRAFVDPDETVQRIFLDLVKPVSALMLDLLGRALPELPKETLIWRFQFLVGAMATAMCMYDNPRFESLKVTETKLDWLIESLLSFVDAGMHAPLSQKSSCSPRESGGKKRAK